MKRFFFLTIALAAAAVSCTKGGLLESPQTYETPISFEPYTGKAPVTKAEVVTTLDIADDGFRVLGFEETSGSIEGVKGNPYLKKVVKGEKTEDGKAVKDWSYTGPMYWQENQTLSFVAYGLNANNSSKSVDKNTGDIQNAGDNFDQTDKSDFTVFTYKVPDKVEKQTDLVISPFIQGKTSKDTSIEIPLYHVLSRVGFQLLVDGSEGVNVIIKNLTLKGTGYASADFDLTKSVTVTSASGDTPASVTYHNSTADGTVETEFITYSLFDSDYEYRTTDSDKKFPGFIVASTGTSQAVPICKNTEFAPGSAYNPGDYDYDIDGEGKEYNGDFTDPTATELANRYMMFLPQTFENGVIEVVYQLAGGVEEIAEISLADFPFAAGKAYEFVFTVSTTAVSFDVEVDIWNPTDGDEDNPQTVPEEEEYPLN